MAYNYTRQAGTTEQSFEIGAGSGKFPFKFNSSFLTSIRTWFLPNSDGAIGDVLTTDGGGNLSWAPPGVGTVSGVFIGDTDCGLIGSVITAAVDLGSSGNVAYSTINLGAA